MNANKSFYDFRERLAYFESRGDYEVYKARGPYWGRYQFGKARLQDLGLMDASGKWLKGLSTARFLFTPEIQDMAFVAHVSRHARQIDSRYRTRYGELIDGVPVTKSGLVAAAHLVGLGAVNQMLRTGTRPADGNGTTAVQYMCWMSGYDIPLDMPMVIDPDRLAALVEKPLSISRNVLGTQTPTEVEIPKPNRAATPLLD